MRTLKISTLSVLCVLCTVATDAFAAGSVRALGGAGTYDGTTAAVTSTAARGTAGARAGSLRVSPSTTRTVSTGTRTNANGTTTPTERLSIGKYLGGATSVSTTGGSGASASETAAEITQINTNLNELHETTQIIENNITELENTKQDKLEFDDEQGIVQIDDDNVVSLNMNNLKTSLTSHFVKGTNLEIEYDGTSNLKWRYNSTDPWTTLLNLDDLNGDYLTTDDLEDKIEELALDGLAARVATLESTVEGIVIPELVQSDWDQADNTKMDYIKNKPDMNDYATTAALGALETTVGTKANSADVYTKTQADTLLDAKADADDVYTKSETYSKSQADTLLAAKADADSVPTDESFAEANEKIAALETTVGNSTSGLVHDVAANADAIAGLSDDIDGLSDDLDSLSSDVGTNSTAIAGLVATTSAHTTAIAAKADAADVYTKSETYSKSQADTLLAAKANASDLTTLSNAVNDPETGLATKADADAVAGYLNQKANVADVYAKTDTYSKTEANALLANKADLDDLPAAPVQSDWDEDDSTSLAYIAHKPEIPEGVIVDTQLDADSPHAIQNKVVTNALPNFDTEVGGVVEVPSNNGAYVLGYVNGKPAYIAVVDANGNIGVNVPWGE